MIRRGLQVLVLVGITALGAAPLFSAPSTITLQGFGPVAGGYSIDGDYAFSFTPWEGQHVYQVAGVEISLFEDVGEGIYVSVEPSTYDPNPQASFRIEPDGSLTVLSGFSSIQEMFPEGGSWSVHLDDILFSAGTIDQPDPDPYEENFPDWASAGVKIPLGFAFGLACWASLYAMAVPFKWVREIANAAT